MILAKLFDERSDPSSLRGHRVLVVEDEYVLAEDLREQLEQQGAEVVGPAASVPAALALLEDGPTPSLAVLDVQLGAVTAYRLADLLRDRGIPFVFITGHEASSVPNAYADVPLLQKPFASLSEMRQV
jgi:CheY-like chemotaxis protein